jgi:hypothetical protein
MRTMMIATLIALAGCSSNDTPVQSAPATTIECDADPAVCNPTYPDGTPK